jgi:hypothetical protein
VNGERHSWGNTVREVIDGIPGISVSALRRLNRLPFVVGVFSLGVAALGVIALPFTAIGGPLHRSFGVRRGTSRCSPSC